MQSELQGKIYMLTFYSSMIKVTFLQYCIDKVSIYASQHNTTGEYTGFDENQMTSDSGGKGLAVQEIKNYHKR